MDLADPLAVFLREAAQKHAAGLAEHRGGDPNAPFEGDLRVEIQHECLDLSNYLIEAKRRGWIDEQVYQWALKDILSLWFLARVTLDGVEGG